VEPVFFATPDELREWLEQHHEQETELWVGLYKVGSGLPSVTWPQVVDECLCFGWIDGIRKGIDATSYANRITPRKPRSTWSLVNIRRVEQLKAGGRMQPPGLRAFAARADERSALYSYEQRHSAALTPAQEVRFRAAPEAWAFFEEQAPFYRQAALHWVTSAKQEATRERRFAQLLEDSAAGRRLRQLTPPARRRAQR
jgi:uncharacterized protein YdeI (YjbR/CyaY-like superfamily)